VVHPVSTEIHSSAYRHKEIIVATPLTTDDAPVPGNSGAMVIDDKGALVGILMGGSGSQVLITPISKVLTFYKTTIKCVLFSFLFQPQFFLCNQLGKVK